LALGGILINVKDLGGDFGKGFYKYVLSLEDRDRLREAMWCAGFDSTKKGDCVLSPGGGTDGSGGCTDLTWRRVRINDELQAAEIT
jgi:hypothetical protein